MTSREDYANKNCSNFAKGESLGRIKRKLAAGRGKNFSKTFREESKDEREKKILRKFN